MRKIYLAGPEVFLPDAQAVGERKKALCREYGFEGLYPLDNAIQPGPGADDRIYAANLAMIHAADAGIFNLSPFRGASADSGTVFELGLMAGLGKALFGYTNSTADFLLRIPGVARDADGHWRDATGMQAEDFGNADNLMIDCCLRAGGGSLVRAAADTTLATLEAFEICLQRASTHFSRGYRSSQGYARRFADQETVLT